MGTTGDSMASVTAAKSDNPASEDHDPDAIYQGGRVVARVIGPEVDLEAKQVRFGEIHSCDSLLLPDECEFLKYRILIQRIAHGSKVDRAELRKGRVLRGIVADPLGYREQLLPRRGPMS